MRCLAACLALLIAPTIMATRPAVAQEQEKDCTAPAELIQDDPKLPLLAARIRQHKPVKIVTVGGSSTAGAAAQSPLQHYPERLEGTLTERSQAVELSFANERVQRQTPKVRFDVVLLC